MLLELLHGACEGVAVGLSGVAVGYCEEHHLARPAFHQGRGGGLFRFNRSPSRGDAYRNQPETCCGDHRRAGLSSTTPRNAAFTATLHRCCQRARCHAARYRSRPPLPATSRLIVHTARPSRLAITRSESPATTLARSPPAPAGTTGVGAPAMDSTHQTSRSMLLRFVADDSGRPSLITHAEVEWTDGEAAERSPCQSGGVVKYLRGRS